MNSKIALCFAIVATFAKISNAVYLPMNDDEMHRFGHGGRQSLKSYDADISNVATQFREPLPNSAPGRPKSVIGTVLAKWLVSEYNREGAQENKLFKLLHEPVSDCSADMDQCQVVMQMREITCDGARGVEDCIPASYNLQTCVATFDMQSLILNEPVLCDSSYSQFSESGLKEESMAGDKYEMLNNLIREGATKSQPKALYEKKWGVDDGRPHPV
ncbi:uncharacterized protein LOC144425285 [Styela clava]